MIKPKQMALALIIYTLSVSICSAQVLLMSYSNEFNENIQNIKQANNTEDYDTLTKVYNMLFEELGEPQNLRVVPLNRQERHLEQTEYAACSLYRVKNQKRLEQFIFSNTTYYLPNYKLYQNIDSPPLEQALFTNEGRVKSLKALFTQRQNDTFIVVPSYSYGEALDRQISMIPSTSIVQWTGIDPNNKIAPMLFAGRANFSLLMPEAVFDHALVNSQATFRSYEIDGIEPVTRSYMMCNKHPDAYAYIKRVNEVLSKLYRLDKYKDAHIQHYSEAEFGAFTAYLSELLKQ